MNPAPPVTKIRISFKFKGKETSLQAMDPQKLLTASLNESVRTKKEFLEKNLSKVLEASELLYQCTQNNKKVLIFGNGGSACDALHFSGEWVNRYKRDRKALAAVALTADAPLLTCIGNDSDFDQIFSRQIEALGQEGDIAIGISTSGNSKNVELGLKAAKKVGMKCIGLLGRDGGTILSGELCDISLLVAENRQTSRIQECHEWLLHAFCEYIDLKILGPDPDLI